MPRRNRTGRRSSRAEPPKPPRPTGVASARLESSRDGDWLVRHIPGGRTTKTYRCPGCDHEIHPGTAHLVAWPSAELGSPEERRHWHSPCWANRHTRTPTRRRWR